MKKSLILLVVSVYFIIPNSGKAQFDEEQLGAWYMYFFNASLNQSSFGIQGDVQYRNWDLGGDLEQLLLRGGLTFKPNNANIKFTLGYGNVTTGVFGSENSTSTESRVYQEALFPVQFGKRFHTNHRFRYEQRFVENQDLRTRYRYNLFLNVALNKTEMVKNTIYLALYNELFINGQRNIGNGNRVEIFDRNRSYSAIGYMINNRLKVQLGIMNQSTDAWSKNQLQLSLHHEITSNSEK